MSNVGYATLSIIPSLQGFAGSLQGQTTGPLASAGQSGGKAMGGSVAASMRAAIGPAMLAVGAVAIGSFVKGAVSAAGELEQSVGAIDAVFKGSAGQMHEWAQGANMAVGLTRNGYNELGSLIGSQLKNAGVAMDEIGPKTNELITLGADLSSMFGGTTADAVEALSSALKGEMDPMERFGVSLTAAAVEAKAAELGFAKVGGALSQQAKSAATVALIYDQTADAQGNFGREADTLAGKQQRLNALFEDGKARIGEAFLPAVSAATGGLLALAGPAIDGVVGGVNAIVGAMSTAGPGVLTALAPIGQAFATLGGPLLGLVSQLSPLGLAFRALEPVLPQIAALLNTIGTTLATNLGSVLAIVTPILGQLVGLISGVLVAALPVVSALLSAAGAVFQALAPIMLSVLSAILPLVSVLLDALTPVLGTLTSTVLPILAEAITAAAAAFGPLVATIGEVLMPVIKALLPIVEAVFGVLATIIGAALDVVVAVISTFTALLSGDWDAFWKGMSEILDTAWTLILTILTGAMEVLGSAVSNGLNALGELFAGLGPMILDLLSGAGSWLLSVGEDLVRGLLNGIGNLAGQIGDAIMEPIAGAVEGVKDFLGIASPSKLMRQIGEWTGEGMAIGLDDSAGLVARASGSLEPVLPRSSYVQAPSAAQIDGGGLRVRVIEGGGAAGPLVGSLTMQSDGKNVPSDVESIVFGLRKLDRGGRVGSFRGGR